MPTKELSVIIPFANEMPTVAFTVQALIEELEGFCDYEIILVDNLSADHCTVTIPNETAIVEGKNYLLPGHEMPELYKQDRTYPAYQRNYFYKNGNTISTWFFRKGKVRYEIFDEKLGHWNAKNHGIKVSTGKYLFFLDAHCIMKRDSVRKMLEFLRNPPEEKIGGVHAYINYMLDSKCLEYKVQRKFFGYQFCSHQNDIEERNGKRVPHFKTKPYKVCVMSTCGMMCPRTTIEELGGWNPELGIYGGGESYINWKQSTCGYPHWILPQAWCWHYADKRGYSWNWVDYTRNSFIAAYCVGGEKWLQQQIDARAHKSTPSVLEELGQNVITTCKADRDFIESKQVMTFDEYIEMWEAQPGTWK